MAMEGLLGGAPSPLQTLHPCCSELAGAWLQAWCDPVASLKTFSQCAAFADSGADGDFRLVVASLDKQMKVYRGTALEASYSLLDVPVALCVFYSDTHGDASAARIPSVGVASGSNVYIYRKFRPYLKFTLPSVPFDPEEAAVWGGLWDGGVPALNESCSRLGRLRDAGVQLSQRAQELLACGSQQEQRELLEQSAADKRLTHPPSCITCMESMPRDAAGDRDTSSLILGTESGQLLFLDATGSRIERALTLPSVPAHLACHGVLGGEYRINIACRDGVVYAVKDGTLMATRMEPGAPTVGLVRTDTEVLLGCTGRSLHSYSVKGRRNWSVALPAAVTAMCRVLVRRTGAPADCCAVALEGGEVRIYASGAPNGRSPVMRLSLPDTVTAMRFGQYGREGNTLILACRGGSLTFKILRRTAQLLTAGGTAPEATATQVAAAAGAAPGEAVDESLGALVIPKKTRLYVEQTLREREQAVEMHRAFQRDLCKLRLAAAKEYVKIITDGGLATSSAAAAGVSLRLSSEVLGLGPMFKIRLELVNVEAAPVVDVSVLFSYRSSSYRMGRPLSQVAQLLPSIRYVLEFDIESLDPMGSPDAVRCHVCLDSAAGNTPAVTAQVAMPPSQPSAIE